jgi:hypothetical protein
MGVEGIFWAPKRMTAKDTPVWTDTETHGLIGAVAKVLGMKMKSVVAHAVREYAGKRGLINEQHPQSSQENHGTAQGRRDDTGVDAPTKQAQEIVDATTCTSSQHKEGVGGRDALSRVVDSTSQNAVSQPLNQAPSTPHGTGQK